MSRSSSGLIAGRIPWIEIRGQNVRAIQGLNLFSVLSLGLPQFAVQRLEARINPLVDLVNLSFPARLASVGIEGDRVVVTGTPVIDPAHLQPRR